MKSIYIIIMLFTICVGFGLFLGAIFRQSAPELKIENKIVDLGKVGAGGTYPVTFGVENQGGSPLTIELERISCTCTVAKMCKSPLAPKERAAITAYINAPKQEELFGSKISLKTNDPKHPVVILEIQGVAETVMLVNPEVLLFGDISSDQLPITKNVTIKPGKSAPLNMLDVLKVGCTNEYFKIRKDRTTNEVNVSVTLCQGAPLGALHTNAYINIEDSSNYKINIPIIANIIGKYEIRPTTLFYGKVIPGIAVTRECRIKSFEDGDRIEVLPCGPIVNKLLEVGVEYLENEAIVKATLNAKPQKGTHEDILKLMLKSNNNQKPQYLQIPIIYMVRD